METQAGGIVFVWGENERLKAYDVDFNTKRITGFRGEGAQFASGNMPAPGGMPGGRLVVSSNGTTPNTGVVWGVYPCRGMRIRPWCMERSSHTTRTRPRTAS